MQRTIAFFLLLLMPWLASADDAAAAPDFTLKSDSGANIRLSEYRGQVVMLNFWASWCGPCRQEMPHLDVLNTKYTDLGFTVLGINVDADRALAEKVLGDIPVEFPILFDTQNTVSQLYEVDAMPMTLLVDRDGEVRHMHRGYKPGYEEKYEQQVRSLVKE